MDQAGAAAHWDAAYTQGDDTRIWFEQHPDMSLRILGVGSTEVVALLEV